MPSHPESQFENSPDEPSQFWPSLLAGSTPSCSVLMATGRAPVYVPSRQRSLPGSNAQANAQAVGRFPYRMMTPRCWRRILGRAQLADVAEGLC